MLTKEREAFLKDKTREIRKDTLDMIYRFGRGHIGGCMSIAEVMTALYYEILDVRPEDPQWKDRDRMIISKGHCAPVWYAILADKGYFEKDRLKTLNQNGTMLPSHCDRKKVPGIAMTAGSLGPGLSAAVGMAIANRLDGRGKYVYCIVGDGESQEGQIWEAVMYAAQAKLDHLIVFIDDNGCQVDGYTKDINRVAPFAEKYAAFGWDVHDCPDGHDFNQILDAVAASKSTPGKPHAIILHTIKAKYVEGAENTYPSHCFAMTPGQYEQTIRNLEEDR